MAHIEDRWHRYVRDAEGKVKRDGKGRKKIERTARHGQGQRWRVRYRDPNHAERTRTFGTRVVAEAFVHKVEVSKGDGSYVDPTLGLTKFSVWADQWMEATAPTLKRHTVSGYKSLLRAHLVKRFGDMPLSRIKPVDVRGFIGEKSKTGSASRVRSMYFLLSSIMKAAAESGYIGKSPCVGVKLPKARTSKEMKFLDADQVRAIAEAVPDRDKALVYVLAYGGLRWGEAAALRVRRVNFLKARVEVVESLSDVDGSLEFGPTKTDQKRSVALPKSVVEMLARHVERHVDKDKDGHVKPDALLFTSPEGEPLRLPNWRRRVWAPALRAVGLPVTDSKTGVEGVRVHDLRHTCTSLLIARGAHLKAVQAHLGHNSISVTYDRYGHLFPDEQQRVADALEETFTSASASV